MERFPLFLSSLPLCQWFSSMRAEEQGKQGDITETSDALIFDRRTGRFRLRQDLFEKAIADAAEAMWSDNKAKNV